MENTGTNNKFFLLKKKMKKEKGIIEIKNCQYKPAKYFSINFGISPTTLRSWSNKNLLDTHRSTGGKRFYSIDSFSQLYHNKSATRSNIQTQQKISYIYCRVRSAKQKSDLDTLIRELQESYPTFQVLSDICSGVNFKRPGLCTLLDKSYQGLVDQVVIMHKDQLARIGYDLLAFLFQKFGVKILVHCSSSHQLERVREQEQSKDLLAIINIYITNNNKMVLNTIG